MSEVGYVKEFVSITPTYTSVLNKQLGKVVDALDKGDPVDAFIKIRTLILISPPKIRDELLKNELAHINRQLGNIAGQSLDLYLMRHSRSMEMRRVLRNRNLDLFVKVMTKLHEGGYLERKSTFKEGYALT